MRESISKNTFAITKTGLYENLAKYYHHLLLWFRGHGGRELFNVDAFNFGEQEFHDLLSSVVQMTTKAEGFLILIVNQSVRGT